MRRPQFQRGAVHYSRRHPVQPGAKAMFRLTITRPSRNLSALTARLLRARSLGGEVIVAGPRALKIGENQNTSRHRFRHGVAQEFLRPAEIFVATISQRGCILPSMIWHGYRIQGDDTDSSNMCVYSSRPQGCWISAPRAWQRYKPKHRLPRQSARAHDPAWGRSCVCRKRPKGNGLGHAQRGKLASGQARISPVERLNALVAPT